MTNISKAIVRVQLFKISIFPLKNPKNSFIVYSTQLESYYNFQSVMGQKCKNE